MTLADFASPHVLTLERTLVAPRAALWRCWTEPELIQQWFCPVPWRVTEVQADLRAGGASFTRMQGPGPDGQPMTQDCPGCYLLIEPMQRLVFTDAFVGDWMPGSNKPFMVGDIRFADALPKTPTERVQKVKLRDEGVTADTFDRETHGPKLER